MATRLSIAAAGALLALSFAVAQFGFSAAEARPQNSSPSATVQPQQPSMADMMKMHERMMAEMQAAQTRLDGLVSDMNAASGEARVIALTAVVNELVRQHKAIHHHMGQMHHHMGQMHHHMMGGHGMMMR
jgi:hypothetical protein